MQTIIKILLIIIINSSILNAKEIQVQIVNLNYDLNYSEKSIKLTNNYFDLSIDKTECNAKLFEDFITKIHTLESSLDNDTTTEGEKGIIKLDSKEFKVNVESLIAFEYRDLIDRMQKVKLTNFFLCESSKIQIRQ